ncbi:MAG: TolC family protein [Nitrospiraceae bacterium]|nr:MAG: TolC family protein [Nitrospiraceae bacterium]
MHNKPEVGSQKSEVRIIPLLSHFSKEVLRGIYVLLTAYCLLSITPAFAEELKLQPLIDEALENNHDILMSGYGISAAEFRIPQAESLPDPMLMLGYQNDGTRDLYTFGDEMASDSMWMFSVSQMFPYPGKRSLKGEMARRDAEGLAASADAIRLKVASTVKALYYDLFLAHKNIDLVHEMSALFSRIEDAALSRYSTGMAPQQEVLMAQTEKYMLLEKEEMLKQNIQAGEAMLNSVVGRDANSPLGRPAEMSPSSYDHNMDELIRTAIKNYPEIQAKEKMISSAETKVRMAKKEYYPDFTVNAGYFAKGPDFPDMWSLAATINIPIFYKSKQMQAVNEAGASLSEAEHELLAMQSMLSSGVRDNYSMFRTSERLMDLYKNGLIPKIYQDFESALAGYVTGRVEAITVLTRLKSVIDYETLYWKQFVEREKAIARLEAITTVKSSGTDRDEGQGE